MLEQRSSADTIHRLERQVRWLRAYALASAVMMLVMLGAAFRGERHGRFEVIDAERINVRTPDGRMAVVIATDERLPGNIIRGKEHPSPHRGNGLLFYDNLGNEQGGLIFHGELKVTGRDSTVTAGGQLSLDRFESDQVAAIRYLEDPEQGFIAGLQVSHFPRHNIAEWWTSRDSIDRLPAAARDTAFRSLRRRFMREGKWEIPRVFVGERGRTAQMEMRDTRGRERIRLVVDSTDAARIEFLDAEGKVISTLPR
ncbi:MAG TPA: hypothetical protein VF705_08235 [Longimicrobium sp.]|jgi:hypothetical protein